MVATSSLKMKTLNEGHIERTGELSRECFAMLRRTSDLGKQARAMPRRIQIAA
jgi:hypothetical protein